MTAVILTLCAAPASAVSPDVERLFADWRAFAEPAGSAGMIDIRPPALKRRAAGVAAFRSRLDAIDPKPLDTQSRNDLSLIRAEMAGQDFDLRVLRPWARDPAFFVTVWPSQTDVPSREGPAASQRIELYRYKFPLSSADGQIVTAQLAAIPALLAQAKDSLKGSNARDLWVYGIRSIEEQSRDLRQLEAGTLQLSSLEGRAVADMTGANPALRRAITYAHQATDDFAAWLKAEAPKKTGPSGIGRENYSWYVRNVHLSPYGWAEEETLLRRELERAHASLRLAEHANRKLPPLLPVADARAYDRLANERLDRFLDFLVKDGILPPKPYFREALLPLRGRFVQPANRSFFSQITHREPMLLYSHDIHWIDLARMRDEPNPDPVRRGPLLFNIWDTRAEGFATGFEEMLMHAGLYADNRRAEELVWIMLANRAARGLASLYVQDNRMTLAEAGAFQAKWTPRGWARAADDLTTFEQLLYLRQPGYGASYISGKLMFDRLLADYGQAKEAAGQPVSLVELMGRFNDAGMVPIPLIEQEIMAR